MRGSEAMLRGILDNVPAAVMLEDPDGRLLLVNRRFAIITGRDAAASRGLQLGQVLPDYAAELLDASRVDVLAGAGVIEAEVELPVNGEPRAHLVTRFPLRDEDGAIVAVCGIATDVEERRRLRDQALRAHKLDSLGTLAHGIAHDVNNILMAFAGNVAVARAEIGPDHPADRRLAAAEAALGQARHLTDQLLMFARGGALARASVVIGETVRDSATFALDGARTRCEFDIAADLWPVEADLGQIHQLVQCLVRNAEQAMPDGGAVAVRCVNAVSGEDRAGLRSGQRCVRLSVRDHGVGIPEDERDRVFDPYFSTREGGTGLGLSSAFAIVRDHGGAIELDSEVGVGTTFDVWLPAAEQPSLADDDLPAPLPAERAAASSRVLVMDDEPTVREVLSAMLDRLGCETVTAEDGASAVALFRRTVEAGGTFDVVILDLTIKGGMGGVETARELLAIDPRLRIVASSGYTRAPILEHHRDHGFAAVLRKPYSLEDLSNVLDDVLAGG